MKKVWLVISCLIALNVQTAEADRLVVTVDPRIELLSVMGVLAGHEGLTNYEISYKNEILNRFAQYRDHDSVRFFRSLMASRLAGDAYISVVMALTPPPNLRFQSAIVTEEMEDYITLAFRGDVNVLAFVEGLRHFAREAQFNKFFDSKRAFYQILIEDMRGVIAGRDYVGILEDYIGSQQSSYTIILGPILHHGGIGHRIQRTAGEFDLYSIIGPVGDMDGLPDFGDQKRIHDDLWHEFAHAYINPLTARSVEQVDKFAHLYDPISEQMLAAGGYFNWHAAVNEHIIRAITSRLFYREFGANAGKEALDTERRKGFKYIDALYAQLVKYEQARAQYPTLESFYPRLLGTFSEFKE